MEMEWSGANLTQNRPLLLSSSSHHFFEFHPISTTTITTTCVDQFLVVDCHFSSPSSMDTHHLIGSSLGPILHPNLLSGMQSPSLNGVGGGGFPASDLVDTKPLDALNNGLGLQMGGPILDDFQWPCNHSPQNHTHTHTNIPLPTFGNAVPYLDGHLVATPFSFPNEGSSSTAAAAAGGSRQLTALTLASMPPSKGNNKSPLIKGQWTPEEDRLLAQLVERHGLRKWAVIARMLNGRIGKQCRERWHNHLRPDIKKAGWSEKEDMVLIAAHAKIGNKWSELAKHLPGRSENAIKNHWNATKRRCEHLSGKRKCVRPRKYPGRKGLALQHYIIRQANAESRIKARAAPSNMADELTLGLNAPGLLQVPEEPHVFDGEEVPEFNFGEENNCCSVDALMEEMRGFHGGITSRDGGVGTSASNSLNSGNAKVKKEYEMINQVNYF